MKKGREGGFTLIEMAVTVSVLAIIATIALPSLSSAISKADAAKVVGDVHTVDVAVRAYMEDTGNLPPSGKRGVVPPALAPYLPQGMSFRYKDAEYRLITQKRKGIVRLLPESVARRHTVFPLRDEDRHLVVASADPADVAAEQAVGFASGRTPVLEIAPPEEILARIEEAYAPEKAAERLLRHVNADVADRVEVVEEEVPEEISIESSGAGPVVRLTNMILLEAVERGASDIHIQPTASGGAVRFRVDGVLRTGLQMPLSVFTRVISRIKILGKMNIADHLRPQDGSARILVNGKRYDLRISTVPTRHAEKAVVRILNPHQTGTLDDTEMQPHDRDRLRELLKRRDGIVVVTGPTGSGKSTTLYAALRELATEDVNIMTVEDPVEYEISGLTQIQVDTTQGVTFASALRAILRQDPDIILVGEIRDEETAEVAAQAALTGHLVLSTLHTNDAVGAIRRFLDLNLDPGTLTETLRGSLSQRLVRHLCAGCKESIGESLTPEEEELAERYGVLPVARAVGCERCGGMGYVGRLPVTELMVSTPALVELILENASPEALRKQAIRDGMEPILSSALARVRQGETTLQEVDRVLGMDTVGGERRDPNLPSRRRDDEMQGRPSHGGSPHALLVDDDPSLRLVARAILERDGWSVTEAGDGGEALALLARGVSVDLVVLDVDMPVFGGKEVLNAIRSSVSTAGIPVVVLTGSSDAGLEVELLEAGADDYLRKPIDPPQFLSRIRAVLRRAGG
ncbi:MAG: ATPase, T2SS/T4P/T4SS family [Gemmatimonadota bacterium]